jgi:hypothetical protein
VDTNTRRKINVEETLWRQIRARAAEQGITVSELVVNAITSYLTGSKPVVAPEPRPEPPKPPKATPVATNAIAAGSGSPQRGVRAAAPLEALPSALEDEQAGLSFGSSRPAPKPSSPAKVSGRPLGRRS